MTKSQVLPSDINYNQEMDNLDKANPTMRLHSKCNTANKGMIMAMIDGIYDEFLFKDGVVIDQLDEQGSSAMHIAARHNNVSLMKQLVEAGANVDIRQDNGYTPLHVAARFNCLEATELLLNSNADVTIRCHNNSIPLHIASRLGFLGIIKRLAKRDIDTINAKGLGDVTPIFLASKNGDKELCDWLIENGADITYVTSENKTPLHVAALCGNLDIVKLLIETASKKLSSVKDYIDITEYEGHAALHMASYMGQDKVAHELIINGANIHAQTLNNQSSILHVAVSGGNIAIIEDLLSHGADIETIDGDHRTPLHQAAISNNEDVIKFLLDKGAKIDSLDVQRLTPFLFAVKKGNSEAASLLLERGANMKAADLELRTCFHLAVMCTSARTLKMLISKDEDSLIDKTELMIQNPLHYAAAAGDVEILNIILKNFCRLTVVDESEMTPLHVAAFNGQIQATELLAMTTPKCLGYKDIKGRTPLHCAAEKGFKKTCEVLLNLRANISSRDLSRRSPLHAAVDTGALSTVKLLLVHKDSILLGMLDKDENTALHLACAKEKVEIVKALLDSNADVTVLNLEGRTCLDVAIDCWLEDVARVLVKHERWMEIMAIRDKDGYGPMKRLIEVLPNIAKIVLDQCITTGHQPANHKEYTVTFNTSLLDPGPDDPPALRGQPFEGPSTMVEYDREDLLNHTLTQALLRYKWLTYGKMIHYANFTLFVILTVLFTYFIVTERDNWRFHYPSTVNATAEYTKYLQNGQTDLASVLTFIVVLELLKEIYQMVMLKLEYFKELSNLTELTLFISALLYLAPYLAGEQLYSNTTQWNAGVIALFLIYLDFLLFIRRIGQGGIYVSMYFEVWYSFVKLLGVFIVVLFGSNVVFYVLLKEEDNFSTLWFSFVKTTVMMVGELDYTDVLSDNVVNKKINPATGVPYVPLPELTYVVFVLFMIAVPVLLMNLLVGLAVGDIEAIQRSASFSRVKDQVKFVLDAQKRYPRSMLRYLYRPELTVKPNVNRYLKRFLLSGTSINDDSYFENLQNMKSLGSTDEDKGGETSPLEKQKRKLRDIEAKLDRQQKMMTAIAEKLGIIDENDTLL